MSRLEAYLRCFDVVVEIVAEGLNVGDVCVAALRSEVAREKDYRG